MICLGPKIKIIPVMDFLSQVKLIEHIDYLIRSGVTGNTAWLTLIVIFFSGGAIIRL